MRLIIQMRVIVCVVLMVSPLCVSAQIDSVNYFILKDYEVKLKQYSDTLRNSPDEASRIANNELFKKTLAEALEVPQSFYFPFDSIRQTISFLNTKDSRVRIITWVLVDDMLRFTNHGVVQYKYRRSIHTEWLKDNLPKDDSLFTELDAESWAGCLYYQGYSFKKKHKTMYCLLGYDGLNINKNRKYIDVLWIDRSGTLHFGAPVFYMSENDYTPQYRVMFEFAELANMQLRFEPAKKYIVYSHLTRSNKSVENIAEYAIPDGNYDYFVLGKKGKWHRQETLTDFNFE